MHVSTPYYFFQNFAKSKGRGGAVRSKVHSFYYDNFSTTIKTFKRLRKRKSAQNVEQFKVGDVFFKLEKIQTQLKFLLLCFYVYANVNVVSKFSIIFFIAWVKSKTEQKYNNKKANKNEEKQKK